MRELHGVIPILDRRAFSSLKQQAVLFDRFYVGGVDDGALQPHELKDCNFLQERGLVDSIGRVIPLDEPPSCLDDSIVAQAAFGVILAGIAHVTPALWKVLDPNKTEFGDWKKLQDGSADFLFDLMARIWATEMANKNSAIDATALCRLELPDAFDAESGMPGIPCEMIRVALESFPLPDSSCAWEDILAFRTEMATKQWAFRRFLRDLRSKRRSLGEIRDDIEWSLAEYTNAMKLHNLKAGASFVEVYVIPAIEIVEDLAKLNWSKAAKGALSIKKRRIELMEAEMKAPGREVAYIYDAKKRFGE